MLLSEWLCLFLLPFQETAEKEMALKRLVAGASS